MCNLYNITANAEAIRQLFRAEAGPTPNLQPSLDLYPNAMAPVVRTDNGRARELAMMTWGYPPPDGSGRWVTNVRNLASPFWRASLANPERRCLVPASRFAEWASAPDAATGRKRKVWFEVADQELFAFAGVWRPMGPDELPRYAFLTTMANALVASIHPKAMPVILAPEDQEVWLSADIDRIKLLARAYPAERMRIVA